MRNVNLDFIALVLAGLPIVTVESFLVELLLDFEEAFFDFFFYFWLQLLLHVMHF